MTEYSLGCRKQLPKSEIRSAIGGATLLYYSTPVLRKREVRTFDFPLFSGSVRRISKPSIERLAMNVDRSPVVLLLALLLSTGTGILVASAEADTPAVEAASEEQPRPAKTSSSGPVDVQESIVVASAQGRPTSVPFGAVLTQDKPLPSRAADLEVGVANFPATMGTVAAPWWPLIQLGLYFVVIGWCLTFGTFYVCVLKKKSRIEYKARRQSHVSRSSAEGCLWLQRAVDSGFQIFALSKSKEQTCSSISEMVRARLEDSGHARDVSLDITSVGDSAPKMNAIHVLPTTDKHTVDFECEVAYDGGLAFTLDAHVPVFRGRTLPVAITLSDLTFEGHLRVKAKVSDTTKDIEVEARLLSEASFGCVLHTSLGPHWVALKDPLVIPVILKRVLLWQMNKRLLDPAAVRYSFKLPGSLDPQQPMWRGGSPTDPSEMSSFPAAVSDYSTSHATS